ncbi:MAG: cupredoxin domain-containing protein [Patescibacteria group bacterium]|jgi:plastocyanin
MKKKNLIFAIIIVLVVLVLVVVLMINTKTSEKTIEQSGQPNGQDLVTDNNSGEQTPLKFNTNEVVPTDLSIAPGLEGAPKQEVFEENKIPSGVIKIEISNQGFKPKEFKVQSGKKVSLALVGTDNNSHTMIFQRASLAGLTIPISSGESKAINFIAPESGSYIFQDGASDKINGTMIVE